MMDNEQKLVLAKAKKKKKQDEQDALEDVQRNIQQSISELNVTLQSGIELNGINNVHVLVANIEQYGQHTADLVERITAGLSALQHLPELDIPTQIQYRQIADKKLLDVLSKVGDQDDLISKLQSLDQTLILLEAALTKDQSAGQTVQDYLPVRIVYGQENALRFLESWPMPQFMGGGGGSNVDISPIKKFALGEFDSIVATYPSSAVEVYQYSLSGNNTYKITVTYTDSSKEVLSSAVRSV